MRIFSLVSWFALGFIALTFAGCASESAEETSSDESSLAGGRCGRDVALHIRADTFFPRPDEYDGNVKTNGCWRFERPRQANWGHCDTATPHIKERPAGDLWFYDEIYQPKHDGADLRAIKTCAASFGVGKGDAYAVWTGLGGFGDRACSPGNICLPDANGRQVDLSPWIKRVWLEVYNDAALDYYRSHRALGRPVIDITHLDDPYRAVKNLCESEGGSGAIGVYVGPTAAGKFTKTSVRMGRLIRAMNECTAR